MEQDDKTTQAFMDELHDVATERTPGKRRRVAKTAETLNAMLSSGDASEVRSFLAGMRATYPPTQEGLRDFLRALDAPLNEEQMALLEQRADARLPREAEIIPLPTTTKVGGNFTNGDNEGAYLFFDSPSANEGHFFPVRGEYNLSYIRGTRVKKAFLNAEVYHGRRLEFFDRDVFFTFCNQAFTNFSDDGKMCMVTLPGLCRALFGKDPTEEELKLVNDSVLRLNDAKIRNVSIEGLVESGRLSKDSYTYGEIRTTGILEQRFLSFTVAKFIDTNSDNTGTAFIFPRETRFFVYEYAKELGRIAEYNPVLIPRGFQKTNDSYSAFCAFRNRMSWANPNKPKTCELEFREFMKHEDFIDRKKRYACRERLKKICLYWKKIGACEFEFIPEEIKGKIVEKGIKIHSINRALIFNDRALDVKN